MKELLEILEILKKSSDSYLENDPTYYVIKSKTGALLVLVRKDWVENGRE